MDIKGVSNGGLGFSVIMAAVILGILTAFVLPIAVNGVANDATYNLTSQPNNSEVAVKSGILNSTGVTDTTNDQVDVTLKDIETGNTQQKTVANGTTSTFTLDGQDVNVTVHDVQSSQAFIQYDTTPTYGWSDGGQAMFDLLDLIFILVVLLTAIGYTLKLY